MSGHSMRLVALPLLLLLAVGGCSDAGGRGASASAPASPSASPSGPPTAPVAVKDRSAKAVVAAYRSYWRVYLEVADPPRPGSAKLAGVATGAELATVRSMLDQRKRTGQRMSGTVKLRPVVVEVEEDTAVVQDCLVASFAPPGGKAPSAVVPPQPVEVELRREADRWKVAKIGAGRHSCPPVPAKAAK